MLRGGQEACEVFPAPLMLAPGGLRTPFLHLSNPVLFPVLQTPNSSCLTTSRPERNRRQVHHTRARLLLVWGRSRPTLVTFHFSQAAVTGSC